MTTTNQTASTRRRITAATLLLAASSVVGAAFASTAPANAADSWVAIAFSTSNGASGYANNQATQNSATQGALNMCRFSTNPFTNSCQIVIAAANQCVAVGTFAPQPGSSFIAMDSAQANTLQQAEQQVQSDGATVKVSRCSTGSGGIAAPPRYANPVLGKTGQQQAH
jgi:hypothetical protein